MLALASAWKSSEGWGLRGEDWGEREDRIGV